MRKINKFIVHCSATREGQDVTVETIRKWHVEGRGWSDIGYHFYIDINGNFRNFKQLLTIFTKKKIFYMISLTLKV